MSRSYPIYFDLTKVLQPYTVYFIDTTKIPKMLLSKKLTTNYQYRNYKKVIA